MYLYLSQIEEASEVFSKVQDPIWNNGFVQRTKHTTISKNILLIAPQTSFSLFSMASCIM